MITVTQTRVRDGERFPTDTHLRTMDDAFERFVIYELGYGGRITDLDFFEDDQGGGSATVKVETRVLGCVDTMTLVGPLNEMKLILQVAALASEHHGFSEGSMDRTINAIMEFTGGSPLLMHMGGDMIAGQHTIRNICVALMGGTAHADRLNKLKLKDMLAALLLVHHDECSLEQAIELAS